MATAARAAGAAVTRGSCGGYTESPRHCTVATIAATRHVTTLPVVVSIIICILATTRRDPTRVGKLVRRRVGGVERGRRTPEVGRGRRGWGGGVSGLRY